MAAARRTRRDEHQDLPGHDGQGQDQAVRRPHPAPPRAAVGGLPQPVAEHEPVLGRGEADPPHHPGLPGRPDRDRRGGPGGPARTPVQGPGDRGARRVRARRGAQHERLVGRHPGNRRGREPGGHRAGWGCGRGPAEGPADAEELDAERSVVPAAGLADPAASGACTGPHPAMPTPAAAASTPAHRDVAMPTISSPLSTETPRQRFGWAGAS
jgi:hypothetical protein